MQMQIHITYASIYSIQAICICMYLSFSGCTENGRRAVRMHSKRNATCVETRCSCSALANENV